MNIPSTLQTPTDQPNPIARALNNAFYLLNERSNDTPGAQDAVANAVMHELLRALLDVTKRQAPRVPEYYAGVEDGDEPPPDTALQRFVNDNEPAGKQDEQTFRDGLQAVLDEAYLAQK